MPFWVLVNLQFKNAYYKTWEIWNTIFCMFSFRWRVVWIFKVICEQILCDRMFINWWFPQRTIWFFWADMSTKFEIFTKISNKLLIPEMIPCLSNQTSFMIDPSILLITCFIPKMNDFFFWWPVGCGVTGVGQEVSNGIDEK